MCPQGHPNQPGPILYPILSLIMAFPYGPQCHGKKYLNLNDWCVPKVIHINQGLSYIISYHGISLWSSMPWPKISKSKWLMCPQGHPHQPGPILYPILSWHFPMVLNAMAKKYIHLKWLICPHNNRSLSCYLLSWNPYIDYCLSFGYLGFPPQIKIIYGPHLSENLNHIQNVLPLVDVLSCRQSRASHRCGLAVTIELTERKCWNAD